MSKVHFQVYPLLPGSDPGNYEMHAGTVEARLSIDESSHDDMNVRNRKGHFQRPRLESIIIDPGGERSIVEELRPVTLMLQIFGFLPAISKYWHNISDWERTPWFTLGSFLWRTLLQKHF